MAQIDPNDPRYRLDPDDPNYGNKQIEDKGVDLLSRLSKPNRPEPVAYDSQEGYYYEEGETVENPDGNEGSEQEEFDPDDPGNMEQRRLIGLQTAIAVGADPNNIVPLAERITTWLHTGTDVGEGTETPPEAERPGEGQDGADPGSLVPDWTDTTGG